MRKKILTTILLASFLIGYSFSWLTPRFIKKNYTFLYDGGYTGIDTLINNKGFYITPRKIMDYGEVRTSNSMVLFYEDGLCVTGALNFKDENELYTDKILPILVNGEMIRDKNKDSLDFFYQLNVWGKYEIIGDTIKVQFIRRAYSLNSGWNMFQKWYKIINHNQIQEIAWIRYDNDNKKWIIVDYNKSNITPIPSTFIPLEAIPPPDAWIKKEKWFWRNEVNWKAYMEKQKE